MSGPDLDKLVMKPTAKRRLGKYVILGRIGAGGMGKIYLAFHPGPAGIEKLVVIKRLHSHLTNDKLLVSSFLDEARLSMALSHPNIVHTYDVGEVDGRYYMAMEHIDGQNLGAVLRTTKRSGRYPSSTQWAGLFTSVLDGLHAAHTAQDARGRPLNIIHRDVSPQNVLIGYDGVPKLVDFGIAKAAMRITETDAGVLKGKYAYMSPEQCEAKELDARSDVFSAGVVLWEMLAGRRLYKSQNLVKSIDRILHEPPPPPTKYNGDCLKSLSDITLKALAKKRGDRFKDAEGFKEAIEEALMDAHVRFRKTEMRDLMSLAFKDVIERQRQVLDLVLAGDMKDLAVVDDETAAGEEGDSESEFEVPNLAPGGNEAEPTTPSASLSPLITLDSEASGHGTRGGRARVAHPATAPSQTPPWSSSGVAAQEETAATLSPLPPSPERQRKAARLLPAVILLLLGAAAAAGMWLWGETDKDATKTADRPSGGEEAPPDDKRAEPDDKVDDKRAAAAPEDDKRVKAPPQGARDKPAETDAPNDKAGTQAAQSSTTSGDTERKKRRRRKPAGKPKTKPPSGDTPPAPAEREPEVERAPAEAPAFGYLTLDTLPWTSVFLEGKKLGNTPLTRVKVPAGELKLVLKNKTEGITETYYVTIKKGRTTKKRLGLK